MSQSALIDTLLERSKNLHFENANEATTRLKLIDEIIRNVLGWELSDIHVEERVDEDNTTRFVDYIITTANTAIVIEAKRISEDFSLESLSQQRVLLSQTFISGPRGKAIIQARDYARGKSIGFAAITNGTQWIVFAANRVDRVEFNKSTAFVFPSLESALITDAQLFNRLLSRDGVVDGFLEVELLGRTDDQLQERRLRNVVHVDSSRPPNPIYPLIENEVTDCFADNITGRSKEFLEICYVSTPDRAKFDNRIKMHLRRKDAVFRGSVIRPMRQHESGVVRKAIETAQKRSRPLALLVLGSVGSGKTTYLAYTREVVASDFFEERKDQDYPHWIYVDLRMTSEGERPIDVIYSTVFEYMQSDIYFSTWERAGRSAYKLEIDSLKRGPLSIIKSSPDDFDKKIAEVVLADYQAKRPYVDKMLRYAASRQPIFLVVDNVDQFESESFQGQVFADAIAFATKSGLNLVLAMRESTFVKHRNHPTFDAFDFDPLSIDPPEISSVLSKRFIILRNELEGKSGDFIAENGIKFSVDNLSVFVDLVQRSVLGTEVGRRIEVLANRDVRLALRMTREFLERGYTEPAKALRQHRENRSYVLPRHEAFRAILLGNQSVYSEAFSVIGNPLDARLARSSSQILRLFVLAALVKFSTEASAEYVEVVAIRDASRKLGYNDPSVLKVVEDLCRLRFIETASHGAPTLASTVFATRLGGYIIKELIADFTFLEAIMMDTFISHDELWDILKDLTRRIASERDVVTRIALRIERVTRFWKNASGQYFMLVTEASRRGLSSEWCTDPFVEIEPMFNANCLRVTESARRNYSTG